MLIKGVWSADVLTWCCPGGQVGWRSGGDQFPAPRNRQCVTSADALASTSRIREPQARVVQIRVSDECRVRQARSISDTDEALLSATLLLTLNDQVWRLR